MNLAERLCKGKKTSIILQQRRKKKVGGPLPQFLPSKWVEPIDKGLNKPKRSRELKKNNVQSCSHSATTTKGKKTCGLPQCLPSPWVELIDKGPSKLNRSRDPLLYENLKKNVQSCNYIATTTKGRKKKEKEKKGRKHWATWLGLFK